MAMPTYAELVERQEANRAAFGQMLLAWRRRNGWTQYTVCNWAMEAGFDAISYGNLSVIEQGKAGELRQKAFWQLGEINRRIAEQEWGPVKDQAIKAKLTSAIPLGDADCPVWTPLELWACYCGLREVPEAFRAAVAPTVSQKKAMELSTRWRDRVRREVSHFDLDPGFTVSQLMTFAGERHRKRFYAVILGFGNYTPEELAELWDEGLYQPERWLDQWEGRVRSAYHAADHPRA